MSESGMKELDRRFFAKRIFANDRHSLHPRDDAIGAFCVEQEPAFEPVALIKGLAQSRTVNLLHLAIHLPGRVGGSQSGAGQTLVSLGKTAARQLQVGERGQTLGRTDRIGAQSVRIRRPPELPDRNRCRIFLRVRASLKLSTRWQ